MKKIAIRSLLVAFIVLFMLGSVALNTSASPQSFSCTEVDEITQSECLALVGLYNSTGGDNWTNHTNWLTTYSPSDWYGVTVSEGHVTIISENNNHLTGCIPPELGDLSNLQELYLRENQLSGSIPSELGKLVNLEFLALNSNQLTGIIPPQLGSLINLQYLYLYWNQLTGSIPPQLGNLAKMQYLLLFSNQLSGSIPSQLGSLHDLLWLYLSTNQLSGSIPLELGNLVSLQNLYLQSNYLSGSIPPELGDLANLQALILSSNQLSGSIPPELGSLANLHWLSLNSNHLSSLIPPELTQLENIADADPQFGPDLELDHNWLSVPNPYPSQPPTALETYLMAKDPDWEKTQGVMGNIPVTGGEVHSSDGRAAVVIPPNGVTQPVTLKITTLTQPGSLTGSLIFANTSFSLTAYDTDGNPIYPFNFAAPATMTLSYQDSDIAGLNESQLRLFYWDTAALG